jgi:peptidoglycan/xylan/chitin deacetylase (PgdA/CDA1 family)
LSPLPELISNLHWLFSNPIDLKSLRGDIWAWGSVPRIKGVLHELLSLLERYNVASTFFISGVCAEQNKDEVLRIKDAGHEIGLHGYRHVPYDMPWAEMMRDMYQAVSVFREIGVDVKGFRAPWLIANKDEYRAAQMLGLTYVSSVSTKEDLQRVDKYNLVELPIYLDDQTLLQKNAVETLLNSSETGRVFEFHLLYVRQRMRALADFLNKLRIDTATLSQIAEGSKGIGLSFDIAYLNRWELLKKLFY